MRRFIRICIGLALLPAAWNMHERAIAKVDKAIGAPLKVTDELPEGMEDQFFGPDPTEAIKTPQAQSEIRSAQRTDLLAGIACVASAFLILTGIMPRRINTQPQPEDKPCAPVE